MGFKLLLIPPLVLLGAAAAPQDDCSVRLAEPGQSLPTPLDLAGRPSAQAGLASQGYATLPSTDTAPGCRSPLPSAAATSTLRSDTADVLHSLPAPDFLKPLGDPKRAPLIQ